jgi:hypothetical protein
MKIRINNNALKKIENSQVAPIVHAEARRRIEKSLREAQREMLQQFESHPVTQEIDMGPDGYNSSGTLGGYGNLYSFIGFEEGMDPIAPIRMLLKKALKIKNSPNSHKSMITNFIIELPSKEEIFSATPNPWASGRSWAEGIEKGISGLGQYLNTQSFSSRSGEGIQADKKIRGGGFSNTKYLSQILNDLKRNILSKVK